jgi:hypothetical protein
MVYKVVVTADAEEDLNQYIRYLLLEKRSEQAARKILDVIWHTLKKAEFEG